MPKDIKIGDWFIFGGMGAYTYSLVSGFNSMDSCKNILVINNNEILVPKEEDSPDTTVLDQIDGMDSSLENIGDDNKQKMINK